MYTVQWCDREGNLHERQFKTMRDAHAEAEYLREQYGEESVRLLLEK